VGGEQGSTFLGKPSKGYSYGGYYRSPGSCYYEINQLFDSGWNTAIQNGCGAWNGAGSRFGFHYVGTTPTAASTYDSHNVVWKGDMGRNNILAQNTYWYDRRTKIVSENDIQFNTYYRYSVVKQTGYYMVQDLATHELGHCLVLNDLYGGGDTELTMYGYGATNEDKKCTLETGDKAGIIYIYGSGFFTPAPPTPQPRALTN
jgi:hypothetical protein